MAKATNCTTLLLEGKGKGWKAGLGYFANKSPTTNQDNQNNEGRARLGYAVRRHADWGKAGDRTANQTNCSRTNSQSNRV